MNEALIRLPLLAFILLGVVFAMRWIIDPPDSIKKYPRKFRIGLFIITCWIGTFVFSSMGRNLGYALNDGIAYDGAAEVPYDVMHDGVGDNVVNLFLGWTSGLIFLALAKAIHGLQNKSSSSDVNNPEPQNQNCMEKPRREIEVVEYHKDWPSQFEQEAARLRKVVTKSLVEIHHIGSTSVPQLPAKPIIDLLLEVSDLSLLDRFNSEMESLGYTVKGEFGIPGRRFYLRGLIERTHHIHAFKSGSSGLLRHLAVRDFLREHPDQAAEYGKLKTAIAKKFPFDNDSYCEAKRAFVQDLEQQALRWANRTQQGTPEKTPKNFPPTVS